MKNGKRPTVAQRKIMEKCGMESAEWLVAKDTPQTMTLVHRTDGRTQEITKEG